MASSILPLIPLLYRLALDLSLDVPFWFIVGFLLIFEFMFCSLKIKVNKNYYFINMKNNQLNSKSIQKQL